MTVTILCGRRKKPRERKNPSSYGRQPKIVFTVTLFSNISYPFTCIRQHPDFICIQSKSSHTSRSGLIPSCSYIVRLFIVHSNLTSISIHGCLLRLFSTSLSFTASKCRQHYTLLLLSLSYGFVNTNLCSFAFCRYASLHSVQRILLYVLHSPTLPTLS